MEARVFSSNKMDGVLYWNGVLDLPVLEEEAFSDLLVLSPDIWDFETSLDDWWSEFISDMAF